MTSLSNRGRVGLAVGAALATAAAPSVVLGEGSEVPDGSVVITSFPFSDTGDTSDNLNDFDPGVTDTCPYSTSTSPEVFYTLTATECLSVIVDLCGDTAYDTKAYVIEDGTSNVVACNDDACTSALGTQYVSQFLALDLIGGRTYHIGVDGWNGARGVYEIEVITGVSCEVACTDTEDEGTDHCSETALGVGTNGDCATTSSSISCGETVCGQYGSWRAFVPCAEDADCPGRCDLVTGLCAETTSFTDLDWYEFELGATADVTVTLVSNEIPLLWLYRADPDCESLELIVGSSGSGPCNPHEVLVPELSAGRYMIVTQAPLQPPGPPSWMECHGGCGRAYELSVACDAFCPDLDGNGVIGFADLNALLTSWGPCPAAPVPAAGNCGPCAPGEILEDDVQGTLDCLAKSNDPPPGTNNDCAATVQSIACGETICGESGTWMAPLPCAVAGDCPPLGCDVVTSTCVQDSFFSDFDWYDFNLPGVPGELIDVTITITASSSTWVQLYRPAPDCASLQFFGTKSSAACTQTGELHFGSLEAGDYKVLVRATLNADGCGVPYRLGVNCVCMEDLDGDGSVGFTDLNLLLSSWGPCPSVN